MREEISSTSQKLEDYRINHMREWYNSESFEKEYAACEDVFKAYWEMKKTLDEPVTIILDQMEEELFILKEAELQAAYMQGMSDCLDMMEDKKVYQSVS